MSLLYGLLRNQWCRKACRMPSMKKKKRFLFALELLLDIYINNISSNADFITSHS